jgi:hypothetical protein
MSEKDYWKRYRRMGSLSFMERCALGYRVRGTDYICDLLTSKDWHMECIWYVTKERFGARRISFEEVFEGVDGTIRQEIIFNLDLFK